MHPTDADHLNLSGSERAAISSRVGTIEMAVEITDAPMPHIWNLVLSSMHMQVAVEHTDMHIKHVTNETGYDAASGHAILADIPVQVVKVSLLSLSLARTRNHR